MRHATQANASEMILGRTMRRTRRRGLSLMEVMFAIGVVMIGLLGIAVLVPIAGKAAQDGSDFERAARTGLNAVREFQMREMGRADNWIYPDFTAVGTPGLNDTAYCIDPRFVAINSATPMPAADLRRFFPYSTGPAPLPRMRRVSLRNWSSKLTNSGLMSKMLADEIFVAPDDLFIEQPADPQLPAMQVYYNQTPANPDKRQTKGEFSWMATITPRNDGSATPLASAQDTYTLSIVVFKGRDFAMPMDGISERWAIIPSTAQMNGFYGAGINGGDVALVDKGLYSQILGAAPPAPNPPDLDLKRGQWILLARNSPIGPMYRWYKVTEAAPDLEDSSKLLGGSPPSGFPLRHVTLFGQDWIFDSVNPANQTIAIIMPGVVSVYEKTIRLENSSLWTQ